MNDERPIEKLLRRYGKKRRDAAGTPELHPATRRLLQSEVARQYPRGGDSAQSFFAVLKSWWPWFAGSIAVLAITTVSVWMFFGGREKQTQIASAPADSSEMNWRFLQSESAKAPETAIADEFTQKLSTNGTPMLTTVERAPVNVLTRRSDTEPKRQLSGESGLGLDADREQPALGDASAAADVPTLSPAPAASAESKQQSKLFANAPTEEHARSRSEYYATPPAGGDAGQINNTGVLLTAAAPAASEPQQSKSVARYSFSRTVNEEDSRRAPEYAQWFAAKSFAPAFSDYAKDKVAPPVLQNFQVQQTGNRLQVIDDDGSVYRGEIVAVQDTGRKAGIAPGSLLKKLPATKTTTQLNEATSQNYLYFVSGTNQTLRQAVTFQWNFVQPTNTVALFEEKKELAPAQNVSPSNAAISGRVEFDGHEIEINAVPVRK